MAQLGLHRRDYPLHEVAPYINWLYFFHAWGFAPKYIPSPNLCECESCRRLWVSRFPLAEQPKANEAVRLQKEALSMLNRLDAQFQTHATVRLMEGNASGNDLLLYLPEQDEPFLFPLLRQQSGNPPFLCLNDFIRPLGKGRDVIGAFATTVDEEMERLYPDEADKRLLVQTLADRLAEATAERIHEEVRKELWGYATDENLSLQDLNDEKFQGIRPAVGYPSLPDISVNHLLYELTDMGSMGIRLTEHAMMQPHASVSGLMIAHPDSRYFAIGTIGQDQVADYARRRGVPTEKIYKYLTKNMASL